MCIRDRALGQLRAAPAGAKDGGVRVAVDVDEPGRQAAAPRLYHARGLRSAELAHSGDAPVRYGGVARVRRAAGAVYYARAARCV